MLAQGMNGSLRILIFVTAAVVVAVASFAKTFAIGFGIAAAGVAGGLIIIVLLGAVASLGREKPQDHGFNASNSLPPDDAG